LGRLEEAQFERVLADRCIDSAPSSILGSGGVAIERGGR
jgi:hypothetical protein